LQGKRELPAKARSSARQRLPISLLWAVGKGVSVQMRSRRSTRYDVHDTAGLSALRGWLRETLSVVDADESWVCDIVVATQEAAANSLKIDGTGRGAVRVTLLIQDDCVWIEVRDSGPGFYMTESWGRAPSLDATSGRGLYLMSTLMDVLEISSRRRGSRVRMGKRLPAPQPLPVIWEQASVAI
jgi:anti-sigma regulatory factor (Ser/Thr protein kinase)